MGRWGGRLHRLEASERVRLRRALEAMTDAELEAIVATGGGGYPDLRAMGDSELRAIIRYLERGGDPGAWSWDGATA